MSDPEHSYDNDGMASLNEKEEPQDNSDEQYEMWVEDCAFAFYNVIDNLIEDQINKPKSYYSNKRERVLEFINNYTASKLETLRKEKKLSDDIKLGIELGKKIFDKGDLQ